MRVMVIVKATPESEAGILPSTELLQAMGDFNEELARAGVILAGDGLKASSHGARVRFSGKSRTVTDGPFAETKELVAGFWIWQVSSLQEAIDWVKRCPNPMESDSDIEIRPLYEMEDFGELVTPEIREQEQRIRAAEQKSGGTSLAEPRYETVGQRQIVGLNAHYSGGPADGIPEQWMRFVPSLGKIPGQVGRDTYGVVWNPGQGCEFDYLCGVQVEGGGKIPDGLERVHLPAATYAVFTHPGHYSAIPQTIQTVLKNWLPQSGRTAAASPMFERYTEEFCPDKGSGGIEIWLPLA